MSSKSCCARNPLRVAQRVGQTVRARKLVAHATFSPPTVATTKQKFLDLYDKPVPSMYNTVVQELLVQQHFMRHNIKYKYDKVFALGITSVFDQILDDMDETQRETIFSAYIKALDETPSTYQSDAAKLTDLARECSSAEDLKPDASGSEIQKTLAEIALRTESGQFFYTRFFAIGLFRLLELTEAREPKALEGLVNSLGVRAESVNKDLLLYKGILSKMTAAKELMREFLEREQRKQKERDEAKLAKASTADSTEAAVEEVKEEVEAKSS